MSASKDKGTKWESAICAYLLEEGFPGVERRALAGTSDKGDIAGLPCVVEAKNVSRDRLPEWVDEANAEALNAGVDFGVVWHHRRGKAHPSQGFVTLSGATFVRLLREVIERG